MNQFKNGHEDIIQSRKKNKQKTGCAACIEKMTPLVLMIGLSVHSLFEGVSLGLSTDTKSTFIMALAIFLHKGAAGMSLGISMQKTFGDQGRVFVTTLMIFFAFFTPIGIFFGAVIAAGEHPLLKIIFNCLAAGTFLYIACSEIIVEEFSTGGRKFMKLCIYLVGIGIIASLLLFE